MTNENDATPFLYQPDPNKEVWVQAKGKRLERRGPRQFFVVGETHDGRKAETQLGGSATSETRAI
jgi:hypothetical protein